MQFITDIVSHNQSWFKKKQSEVHTKYEDKFHLLLIPFTMC